MRALKQQRLCMNGWLVQLSISFIPYFWLLRNLKFGMEAEGRVHEKKTKKGNFPLRKNLKLLKYHCELYFSICYLGIR